MNRLDDIIQMLEKVRMLQDDLTELGLEIFREVTSDILTDANMEKIKSVTSIKAMNVVTGDQGKSEAIMLLLDQIVNIMTQDGVPNVGA